MSIGLYKILEVFNEEKNEWELVKIGTTFTYQCSGALRDELRHSAFAKPIEADELSSGLIEKKVGGELNKYIKFFQVSMDYLYEILDRAYEDMRNLEQKVQNTNVERKVDLLLKKFGIDKAEFSSDCNLDFYEETMFIYETIYGVSRDIAEIDLIKRLANIGNKKMRVVFYFI